MGKGWVQLIAEAPEEQKTGSPDKANSNLFILEIIDFACALMHHEFAKRVVRMSPEKQRVLHATLEQAYLEQKRRGWGW